MALPNANHSHSQGNNEVVSNNASDRTHSPVNKPDSRLPHGLEPNRESAEASTFIPELRKMIEAELNRPVERIRLDQQLNPQSHFGPMFDLD